MIYGLMVLAAILYYVGGEKWAHTLFRDWGVPLCVTIGLGVGIGWHWSLSLAFLAMWGALALGDYGKWHWSVHGLAVGVSVLPYSYFYPGHLWSAFVICAVLCPVLTYIWSRWVKVLDVWQRGLTYGAIPVVYFLVNR